MLTLKTYIMYVYLYCYYLYLYILTIYVYVYKYYISLFYTLSIYYVYICRVISGRLFNESWVELDDEIRSLQVKHGLLTTEV